MTGVTVACRDEDFADWHGGCTRAAIWAVEADTDGVRAAVAAVRDRWARLLLPRYERQPHVTVSYRGLVAEPGCTPADVPFTPETLGDDLARLRGLRQSPFVVEVGGWGTFPMVPFLHASAPELDAANRALGGADYVAHVTAGHYAVSVPLAESAELADGWEPPRVRVDVEALALMTYETHDIAGPLRVEGRLMLGSGEFVTT